MKTTLRIIGNFVWIAASMMALLWVVEHQRPSLVHAQSNWPYQFTVGPALHTACTTTPNVTTYCYADDGEFQSVHGASWQQVGGGVQGVPPNFSLDCKLGTGTIPKGFKVVHGCNITP